MKFCADQGIAVIPWSPLARGFLAGSGSGGEASTVRARSDAYASELRHRVAPGRGDPAPGRRRRGQVRRQTGGRGAGLGPLQTLCHRADRRRLQAASSRRRGGGLVAETRREDHRPARGALPSQGGGRARVQAPALLGSREHRRDRRGDLPGGFDQRVGARLGELLGAAIAPQRADRGHADRARA